MPRGWGEGEGSGRVPATALGSVLACCLVAVLRAGVAAIAHSTRLFATEITTAHSTRRFATAHSTRRFATEITTVHSTTRFATERLQRVL